MTTINRRVLMALAASMAAAHAAQAQDATPAESSEAAAGKPEVKDYALGSADAPVTILEYASFTCPHCASFHANVFKNLRAEYIDTGKVRFIQREVYFDRYGLWAALVARCGGDMRYFGISDMLFEKQGEWAALQDPTQVVAALRTIGLTAGLTNEALDQCLADAPMVEAMVEHFETNAKADNLEGTPTLFINGEKFGNMSWADLKAIVDKKLEG